MPRLKIRISPDGSESEILVTEQQGAGCVTLTKSLEDAVFGAPAVKEYTDDFYQDNENEIHEGAD
jgi:hypothetical protein